MTCSSSLVYTYTRSRKGHSDYSTHERTAAPSQCKQRGPLTLPMGLCGVFNIMAFVLELNLLSSSRGSKVQSELVHFILSVRF